MIFWLFLQCCPPSLLISASNKSNYVCNGAFSFSALICYTFAENWFLLNIFGWIFLGELMSIENLLLNIPGRSLLYWTGVVEYFWETWCVFKMCGWIFLGDFLCCETWIFLGELISIEYFWLNILDRFDIYWQFLVEYSWEVFVVLNMCGSIFPGDLMLMLNILGRLYVLWNIIVEYSWENLFLLNICGWIFFGDLMFIDNVWLNNPGRS